MIEQEEINQAIENSKADFYHDLAKLMEVKSDKGSAEPGAPFGKGPREALDLMAKLIEEYGFKAKIVNNAMVYAQWGSDDQNYIGVVDHLDVVAPGDKWDSNPWSLTKRGERFYGRGILDNKGPAFSTLWGMKLLKDLGFKPKRTIRLIFGSDEESGSADIPLYLKNENPPIFGWTADCKYPVVYGERGIVNYSVFSPIKEESLRQISDFKGNMSKDHVPDELEVIVNDQKLNIIGKRVPSNAPEMGKNSITYLAKKIVDEHLVKGELFDYFKWLEESLHNKHFGEGLGIAFSDEDSGKLIITPTEIRKEKDGLRLEVAIRYPVSFKEDQITEGLKKHLPKDSTVKIVRSIPSVMHDKNSPFIKVLSKVYTDLTGLDGTPVTTTGATYARVMPNIIAFGPSFPGQKGIAHKENEWMNEKDLLMNMKIYLVSLMKLSEL